MDPRNADIDLTCPKCGRDVSAIPVTQARFDRADSSQTVAHFLALCPRRPCGKLVYVQYDKLNDRVVHVEPPPGATADSFHKAIPQAIREDYAEAERCLHASAYKGAVVMARRVMQQIAEDRGATGNRLVDQIEDMFSKSLITTSLYEAAHEIRFFGNYGAHPHDDRLDNISIEDAGTVMGLVRAFLSDLYIRPHETARLTKKRAKTDTVDT